MIRSLINEDRGVKLPLTPPGPLTDAYRVALENLVSHPKDLANLARNAHDYAVHFYSWKRKAKKTREIYDWLVRPAGSEAPTPAFFA